MTAPTVNPNPVLELTDDTFDPATSGPGLTVIDFWAPWCGPCRAMAPNFERAARLRPQHRFAKVNVDEQPRLAAAFGVRSIPTIAVLRDGELVAANPGVIPADALVAGLDRVSA